MLGHETLDYFRFAIGPQNIDLPARTGTFPRHESWSLLGHPSNMRLWRPGSSQLSCLNRRSQPGRHPFHRMGFGDDLIDMVAIDALKPAHLESDPRRLDACQDHRTPSDQRHIGAVPFCSVQNNSQNRTPGPLVNIAHLQKISELGATPKEPISAGSICSLFNTDGR